MRSESKSSARLGTVVAVGIAAIVLGASLRGEEETPGQGRKVSLAAFPTGGSSAVEADTGEAASLFHVSPAEIPEVDDIEAFFRAGEPKLVTEGGAGQERHDSIDGNLRLRFLFPPAEPDPPAPGSRLGFHERLPVRLSSQRQGESRRHSTRTQLETSGSITGPGEDFWIIAWSSEMSYIDGSAPWDEEDIKDADLLLRGITTTRRFGRQGFLRAGYRLSPGVSGIGVVDGAQAELSLGPTFRLGAVAGLTPDRRDGSFSTTEPRAMAYVSAEAGRRNVLHYSGTVGVLGSVYRGEPDRLAYVLEQRAELGSRLRLQLSSEVDVDASLPELKSIFRLTRTRLESTAPLSSSLTLRAGFDHQRRPDTRAERDIVAPGSDQVFEEAARRYWVGGDWRMPLSLELDAEVSYVSNPGDEDFSEWWRVSLTRQGLPSLSRAAVSANLYNLNGSGEPGYGGALTASVPILERRLSLSPGVGFRLLEPSGAAEDFRVTDCSLRASWRSSEFRRLHAGIFWSFIDSSEWTFLDLGIQCIW